jgi:REP element-mobilizing transposase RayT
MPETPWIHLVARTQSQRPIFHQRGVALHAWQRLRAAFPNALASMLMPEHLHLIVPRTKDAIFRLGIAIRSVTRGLKSQTLWEAIPPPKEIADRQHLWRTVRYVLLNPCRRKLVDDPLKWEWSTHRDVQALVEDPWVTADYLSRALGSKTSGFASAFHSYLCREDGISPGALTPPARAVPDLQFTSLKHLEEAYAVFKKVRLEECRQRGPTRNELLQLAQQFGQVSPAAVISWLKISSDTYYRQSKPEPSEGLSKLRQNLSPLLLDPRLNLHSRQ